MNRYSAQIEELPPSLKGAMRGKSWHADFPCPCLEELRLLTLTHWNFDEQAVSGELVLAASVAHDVAAVFEQLFAARFPIAKMRPIHHYAGDDLLSMEDNNCHAFNCRLKTGSQTELSNHSFGTAIDINPVQNPYEKDGLILPQSGVPYARTRGEAFPSTQGVIQANSVVVRAFAEIGWDWGGHWTSLLDTQHFERKP